MTWPACFTPRNDEAIQVLNMSVSRKSAKIPLSLRLKAWWEGYDLAIRPKQKIPLDMGTLSQDAVRYDAPEPKSMRLEVMQQIWGKGMSGPGDEDYILRLVKPLGLSPAHTVIDVGAGLGGATRL
ncbi:MAG TPA: hypothetical protein VKZ46_04530, partial [Pedomonas sp.]|nr:hypothetical protein [Pedomonas sp.]